MLTRAYMSLPGSHRILAGILCATLVGTLVGTFSVAKAANPSAEAQTVGLCVWQGDTSFTYSPSNYAFARTWNLNSHCGNYYLRVEGAFWGSDYQWHYHYKTCLYSPCVVEFPWWTDHIYGDHYHHWGLNPAWYIDTEAY